MKLFSLSLLAALLLAAPAHAADDYALTLKDHQFAPNPLTVPANEKIKLTVKNLQSEPAEFESTDLNREKVVTPNGEIVVYIGPLPAGTYSYFDDFHRATTGVIVAKEK